MKSFNQALDQYLQDLDLEFVLAIKKRDLERADYILKKISRLNNIEYSYNTNKSDL